MLLLAIDTSGAGGSIALAQCGTKGDCQVLEVVPIEGGTFSAQLVPQVATLLAKHGFTKQDIDGFAAASGPGSFTGLRVGLAAVKALAEVLHKPIATVSVLEAIAVSGATDGTVTAVLDAGRNEVFVGEYQVGKSRATLHREQVLTRTEWLQSRSGSTVVTPDQLIVDEAAASGLQVRKIERPRADLIAKLGWTKILAGQTVAAEDLDANYIRRSDAEIFFKPGI